MPWTHFPIDTTSGVYGTAAFWNQFVHAMNERIAVVDTYGPPALLPEFDAGEGLLSGVHFLQQQVESLSRQFISQSRKALYPGQPELWYFQNNEIYAAIGISPQEGFTRRFPRTWDFKGTTPPAAATGQRGRSWQDGKVYEYDGNGFVAVADPDALPDTLTSEDIRPIAGIGDYFGHWLAEELYAAINLLTSRVYYPGHVQNSGNFQSVRIRSKEGSGSSTTAADASFDSTAYHESGPVNYNSARIYGENYNSSSYAVAGVGQCRLSYPGGGRLVFPSQGSFPHPPPVTTAAVRGIPVPRGQVFDPCDLAIVEDELHTFWEGVLGPEELTPWLGPTVQPTWGGLGSSAGHDVYPVWVEVAYGFEYLA